MNLEKLKELIEKEEIHTGDFVCLEIKGEKVCGNKITFLDLHGTTLRFKALVPPDSILTLFFKEGALAIFKTNTNKITTFAKTKPGK